MQRIVCTFLFWTLLLCACSLGAVSSPALPGATTEAPTVVATTAVPTLPPCGYQWAYQDLRELSSSFQKSIQALQQEAEAKAYAFGENCVLEDGTVAAFIPMETDFNITLQVADLADESDLGGWIVKVMQAIEGIPQEQLVGPRPGRVNIIYQTGADQKAINFYINQYQDLPTGLNRADIFQALQAPQ